MGKQEPIAITGLWLRTDGQDMIVEIEYDNEWREVIRSFVGPMETLVSHIVEPLGMRNKMTGMEGANHG